MSRTTEASAADALSERDLVMLEFERSWFKYAGAKEARIRELFDMTSTRYYQVLNSLLDRPEAMATEPLLVKRLRRLRDERRDQRSARRSPRSSGGIGTAVGVTPM